MTQTQRSVCRNAAIGSLVACLVYFFDSAMLSMLPEHHSMMSLALLGTSCTASFVAGFTLFISDDDPTLFKYLTQGARITLPLTTMAAFLGLLMGQWWGLGLGFVLGIWASIPLVKLVGPEKPVDANCKETNYFYSMVDYYSRGMRIPSAVIPPLALLGVFLFQWWGLGAGIILGGLISSLGLGLWGPEKPILHVLAPDQPEPTPAQTPATSLPKTVQSQHTVSFTKPMSIPFIEDKGTHFLSKSI